MAGWLGIAIVLGLSAGLSPGPMLALVLGESLRNGFPAGLRVACAPLITDGPIIAVVALPFILVADPTPWLTALGFIGGLYLAWLGISGMRVKAGDLAPASTNKSALRRGVLANFLNPNPYLFWLSVGIPAVLRIADDDTYAAAGFVVLFYLLLVGSKIALAWLASRGRERLNPQAHTWILRGLSLALLGYAAIMVAQSLAAIS